MLKQSTDNYEMSGNILMINVKFHFSINIFLANNSVSKRHEQFNYIVAAMNGLFCYNLQDLTFEGFVWRYFSSSSFQHCNA